MAHAVVSTMKRHGIYLTGANLPGTWLHASPSSAYSRRPRTYDGTGNRVSAGNLNVRSRTDLVRYLSSLAEKARAGTIPIENPDTADFIEASGA